MPKYVNMEGSPYMEMFPAVIAPKERCRSENQVYFPDLLIKEVKLGIIKELLIQKPDIRASNDQQLFKKA